MIFDIPNIGFARWAKKRLELLGYRVIETPYKYDIAIALYAERLGAIVVTSDKRFPYRKKIVLPQKFVTNSGVIGKPKYEKLYTILMTELSKV